MRAQSVDTPAAVEEVLIHRYRAMGPQGRLQALLDLNRALDLLALAGIRSRHGAKLTAREEQLRLFALRLDRQEMIRAFGWDPEKEGY